MVVSIGRRTEVAGFAARWTIPLAVLATVVVLLSVRPQALAVMLAGLVLDALGAITLGFGLLSISAARVRVWKRESEAAIGRLPWWTRWCATIPILAAKTFAGSTLSTSSSDVEDTIDAFWGLALLVLGFVAQVASAWLQTTRVLSTEMSGI